MINLKELSYIPIPNVLNEIYYDMNIKSVLAKITSVL